MGSNVLKGQVGNYKYKWHSNMCACKKCQELDNMIYENEADIPDKPHPNCKCYIEAIEEKSNNYDSLADALAGLNEILREAKILKEEIVVTMNEFHELLLTQERESGNIIIIENVRDALEQLLGTVSDFIENYNSMKKVQIDGADKYFHSKANCEGTQRGKYGELVAKAISDLRELTDLFRNILEKGYDAAKILVDKEADQAANRYGRMQGKQFPKEASGILVDKYRPEKLPDEY